MRDFTRTFRVAVLAANELKAVAEAGEEALRECGLGYRARSLHRAAARLAEGELDLEEMRVLSNDELREALCGFYGVGEKIANCVMLFGYRRLDGFPVDVWIERIMREHYHRSFGKKAALPAIEKFGRRHFGPYCGYAQQYLFHYARCAGR